MILEKRRDINLQAVLNTLMHINKYTESALFSCAFVIIVNIFSDSAHI